MCLFVPVPRGVHRHLQQHGEPAALPLGLHLIGLHDHLSRHLHAHRWFFLLIIHLLSLCTSPVQYEQQRKHQGEKKAFSFLSGFVSEKTPPEVWDEVSSILWRSQAVLLDPLVCLVHCFSSNWNTSASSVCVLLYIWRDIFCRYSRSPDTES